MWISVEQQLPKKEEVQLKNGKRMIAPNVLINYPGSEGKRITTIGHVEKDQWYFENGEIVPEDVKVEFWWPLPIFDLKLELNKVLFIKGLKNLYEIFKKR